MDLKINSLAYGFLFFVISISVRIFFSPAACYGCTCTVGGPVHLSSLVYFLWCRLWPTCRFMFTPACVSINIQYLNKFLFWPVLLSCCSHSCHLTFRNCKLSIRLRCPSFQTDHYCYFVILRWNSWTVFLIFSCGFCINLRLLGLLYTKCYSWIDQFSCFADFFLYRFLKPK